MKVSHSKVRTYRRCPKKFEFKYEMGLRPKKKSVQLERGSWIHDLLMHHYDGEDWRVRHKHLTKQFKNLFDEEREELGDLPAECKRIMRSYLRTYEQEDAQYRIVDSELDEIVTLPNGLQLQVIVDLVVEDKRGGLWIWDHKTRKSFENSENMVLDPQLTLYYWAMERLGYKPLMGAVYNEIRTKAPVVPKLTAKTRQLERRKNMDTDVFTYMSAVRKHGFDPNDYADILRHLAVNQKDRFFRRQAIPKDPPVLRAVMRELVDSSRQIRADQRRGRFPRTYDSSCRWQCEYKDVCIAQLHGADISSLIKMQFDVRKRKDEDEYQPRIAA